MTEEKFFALLLSTMTNARKNKRYGKDSVEFECNWAPKLVRMFNELEARTYRIRENYTFLTSIPKWREIFATEFSGRIADHLLCDTLGLYIEQELHPRTFNNRIGMGSQAAINQIIEDILTASNGYTETAWIIKWDLKGFFPNALCDYMESRFIDVINKYEKEIAATYDWEEMPAFLKWLTAVVIHCYPSHHFVRRSPKFLWDEHIAPEKSILEKPDGTGVPIGRMSSQEGMGLYINDDIKWLNDTCGIPTTLYMDDGVMVVPDRLKGYALSHIPVLRERLKRKGVAVNDKKFYCQQHWKGLEFLGSHIKPNTVILNDNTYERCIERVTQFNEMDKATKYQQIDSFISTVNSYTGLLKNRTSFKRITDLKEVIDSEWWEWLEWDQRRLCIVCQENNKLQNRLNRKYNLNLKLKDNETSRNYRAA